MTKLLSEDERVPADAGPALAAPRLEPVSEPAPTRPRRRPGFLATGGVLLVLVAAFSAHLAVYGAWIVDDAGISIAYARNLVDGQGLVAQPGAAPVEGFSNPLWVALLAMLMQLGLLGRVAVVGAIDYAAVFKGLAILLHTVVLVCIGLVVHRVLTVIRGATPSSGVFMTTWAATGLLLAANPSYVIWMTSGLENPLLAAEVAALTAVAVFALPNPRAGHMVAIGALGGLAALTRPDGLVYVAPIVVVAAIASGVPVPRRASLGGTGVLAFVGVLLPYVVFRRLYFEAWLPNTAVAKDQDMPSLDDIEGLSTIFRSLGWLLAGFAVIGAITTAVRCARAGNGDALRVLAAFASILAAAVTAYLVLPADWMTELRFLTPAWPLVSVAAVLGAAALVTVPEARGSRVVVATVLVLLGMLVAPAWWDRAQRFRAGPTLPLCFVADRYGEHFDAATRRLGLDPASTSVLIPDIGGLLLVTDLTVVDLAGLTHVDIARLLRDGDRAGIARLVLEELRPTFIHVQGNWVEASGLRDHAAFRRDYVDVYEGQEWVRRDVAARARSSTLDDIAADAARREGRPPRASCGTVLFA